VGIFLSSGCMLEALPKADDFSVEGFGEGHRRFQECVPSARSVKLSVLRPEC
jgi:hypothetical protein